MTGQSPPYRQRSVPKRSTASSSSETVCCGGVSVLSPGGQAGEFAHDVVLVGQPSQPASPEGVPGGCRRRFAQVIEDDGGLRTGHGEAYELRHLVLANAGVERQSGLAEQPHPRPQAGVDQEAPRLVLKVAAHSHDERVLRVAADRRPSCLRVFEPDVRDGADYPRVLLSLVSNPLDLGVGVLLVPPGLDEDRRGVRRAERSEVIRQEGAVQRWDFPEPGVADAAARVPEVDMGVQHRHGLPGIGGI
jgi:hypothetical protein